MTLRKTHILCFLYLLIVLNLNSIGALLMPREAREYSHSGEFRTSPVGKARAETRQESLYQAGILSSREVGLTNQSV
jgi:hypothetical protein